MFNFILVPVDLNDADFADKAVKHALWMAEKCQAKLHLITALPGIHNSMVSSYFPEDAAKQMKQDVKTALQAFADEKIPEGQAYTLSVEEGKPYKSIVKTADQLGCDLILMPSHKRSRSNKFLLGSTASKVLENAKVHVMILKH
ncbi:universal stress protein [Veronia nyctiphanis]|uniref:Universal stress protein n=1 Tax=Veronia nyctiphanis TaxID=1278244 RepID=A0A4Q0YRU9_9GAMM|nr:universal stress protein [Veronia nyctiphanis]RXJ73385.1 universal stress protein [Veronia nyctiphanis]